MRKLIKIGSRDSSLALWQAHFIQNLLRAQDIQSEIILIKSEGDINLKSPLYEMGVQGIFTKTLDMALLSDKIDIAVHSLKDIPTQLPKGLMLAAVPKRGKVNDVLVYKDPKFEIANLDEITIATSSLRRKAQWLHKFPNHTIDSIRGNINTRLEKLKNTANWKAAIFAAAGIDRIGLDVPYQLDLEWMLPAPAQGALGLICRENDLETESICQILNHHETFICTGIERSFLRGLKGGCSTPIGALAMVENEHIHFKGNILSLDGSEMAEIEMDFNWDQYKEAGYIAANNLLERGGDKIASQLEKFMIHLNISQIIN